MELRHLRYFISVAENGSFSAAAEKLFISQPPLSLQIKQLEEEVGVPLLIRLPRGVQLTQAGIRFLEEAKAILNQVEKAKGIARHAGNEQGGILSIGFVPSASHTVLPSFIRKLRSIKPHVEIKVREMVTAEQIAAIEERKIDVGIARPFKATKHHLNVAASLDDPFCIALPEDHPLAKQTHITLSDIQGESFVFFTRYIAHAYYDQIIGLCTEAEFSPNILCEASTIYGVLDLVSSGLGISIVPASTVLLNTKGVEIIPILNPTRPSTIAFLHSQESGNSLISIAANCMEHVLRQIEASTNEHLNGASRWG
ncbi:MAG: LysR substrate-binding domain-containing protein [Pseudomonadota bacterium]|nr:LysR substrate-binding domain-containing protein [Pseudomonadota bacterium]